MQKQFEIAASAVDHMVVPFVTPPKTLTASYVMDLKLGFHTLIAMKQFSKVIGTDAPKLLMMVSRMRAWAKIQPEAVALLQLDLALQSTPDMY